MVKQKTGRGNVMKHFSMLSIEIGKHSFLFFVIFYLQGSKFDDSDKMKKYWEMEK
jgi:hypothetical protein